MKVLINTQIGGYGLSLQAIKRVLELKGYTITSIEHEDCASDLFNVYASKDGEEEFFHTYSFNADKYRCDKDILQVYEELGSSNFGGRHSDITCISIPDDVGMNWYVDECETGVELVREKHRIWYE